MNIIHLVGGFNWLKNLRELKVNLECSSLGENYNNLKGLFEGI